MTPEQINTITNALVEVHAFLDQHGPGLLAAAIAGSCWITAARIRAQRARRRKTIRQGIRRLEAYANHPGARRLQDDTHNQIGEEEL